MIARVVAAGKATLAELATILTLEDLHDLLEIIAVENHNARIDAKRERG